MTRKGICVSIILGLLPTLLAAGWPCRTANCNCGNQTMGSGAKTISMPRQPMRLSPHASQLRPNRVLIITPLDRQDRLKEQVELRRELASSLRAVASFDVVEASRRVCEATYPIRTGRFDERKLIKFGQQYNVDTVLYCNIESIDAYSPMRLEIQYLLINVEQSISVVSGSQRFNLGDKITEQFFYKAMNADPKTDPILKNSPSRLIHFGAAHLAMDLARVWK